MSHGLRRRLPELLDKRQGPAQGAVDPPLHLAWSGMTAYALGKARRHMGLYRTVLHEGLRNDLLQYLSSRSRRRPVSSGTSDPPSKEGSGTPLSLLRRKAGRSAPSRIAIETIRQPP